MYSRVTLLNTDLIQGVPSDVGRDVMTAEAADELHHANGVSYPDHVSLLRYSIV